MKRNAVVDLEAERERRRKAAIYARHGRAMDRRRAVRRWRRVLTVPVLAIAGGLGLSLVLWLGNAYAPHALTRVYPAFAPPALMRAYPGTCAQARAMGYGNARIGTEGYFAHLDADGDGISCEPWPPAWQ